MKYFKREQIHVVDGDALIENQLPELRKIESFLCVKHEINDTNVYFDKRKGFYCVTSRAGRYVWEITKAGNILKLNATSFKS